MIETNGPYFYYYYYYYFPYNLFYTPSPVSPIWRRVAKFVYVYILFILINKYIA